MEWLKELLKNVGVENVDNLESKISKELPKYFKPAKEFNEISEELKVVKGVKKTLEEDKKKIEGEYENFKKGSIIQADYEAKKKEIEPNSKAEIENKTRNHNHPFYGWFALSLEGFCSSTLWLKLL